MGGDEFGFGDEGVGAVDGEDFGEAGEVGGCFFEGFERVAEERDGIGEGVEGGGEGREGGGAVVLGGGVGHLCSDDDGVDDGVLDV